MAGKGNLMYQVAGSYYLPWDELPLYPRAGGRGGTLVSIDVAYDRTELAVNDTVGVDVIVTLNEPGAVADSGDRRPGSAAGLHRRDRRPGAAGGDRFQDMPDGLPAARRSSASS